jgi:hypothetical protein
MVDALAITIALGDGIPGWLPLLPDRFALDTAYRRALGFGEGDTLAPSGVANEGDFGAVMAAAVGLCWGGPALDLVRHTATGPVVVVLAPGSRAFRTFGRDVVAFGDAVLDALLREYDAAAIFRAGKAARGAMFDIIPTRDEVADEAGFTKPPAAAFTEPS